MTRQIAAISSMHLGDSDAAGTDGISSIVRGDAHDYAGEIKSSATTPDPARHASPMYAPLPSVAHLFRWSAWPGAQESKASAQY
jgi:hypothetical protein